MNQELKALLDLAFVALQIGQDALDKKNIFEMLPDFYNLIVAIPSAASHWPDLQNEMKNLGGTQQESDLIEYIEMKFKYCENQKAESILAASLDLIQCVAQKIQMLEKAIQD